MNSTWKTELNTLTDGLLLVLQESRMLKLMYIYTSVFIATSPHPPSSLATRIQILHLLRRGDLRDK